MGNAHGMFTAGDRLIFREGIFLLMFAIGLVMPACVT